MELNVKLQVFEGPLDLLLHLLEKNKVNISRNTNKFKIRFIYYVLRLILRDGEKVMG